MKLRVNRLVFLTGLLLAPFLALAAPEQPLSLESGERLLVLAPHPDDETLSSAGLIGQVLDHGGTVRTVIVTAGDAYVEAVQRETGKRHPKTADYLAYGEKRLEEARRASHVLGNGFIHLDLLGFSDGSLYPALVSHWRHRQPMRSDYTGFSHVPYRLASDKGIAQDGEDLHDELLAILRDTRPTLIAFPDVMENDSDHAGLGMFALLALHDWLANNPSETLQPRLLAYLIHWQHGWPKGSDWGISLDWSNTPLPLPEDLPLRGHQRTCIALNQQDILRKRNALAQYQTQQRAMGDFLAAFVRNTECFTLFKPDQGQHVEQVVEHWRHARKIFDSHPLSRSKL